LTIRSRPQDFLRPIITPFELELALTSKAWTGDYILDFAQLLESSDFGQDAGTVAVEQGEEGEGEEGGDEEAPVFSAVTGTYRHPKKYYQRGFKGESRLFIATHPVAIRFFL
jgi:diphthamide biosynthesis protein 2